MKFRCNVCEYYTDVKCNFITHNASIKHVKNVLDDTSNKKIKVHRCKCCDKKYKNSRSRYTHEKKCDKNPANSTKNNERFDDIIKEIKIIQLTHEIASLKKDNRIMSLEKDVYYKNIIIENKNIVIDECNKSNKEILSAKNEYINWMKLSIERFLRLCVTDAPIVETLNKESSNKLLDSTIKCDISGDSTDQQYDVSKDVLTNKKFGLERDIIRYYKSKSLDKFFGDLILSVYLKADPMNQTVWTSDVSRKKFYLRKEIEDINNWITDTGGLEFSKLSINILLIHAHERLLHFMECCTNRINYLHGIDGKETVDKMGVIVDYKTSCYEIFTLLKKKEIHSYILKYVTPHFKLKKEEFVNHINSIDSTHSSVNSYECETVDVKPKKIKRSKNN